MEGLPGPLSVPKHRPDLEEIKEKLVKHGVQPTPRILHNLRNKEIQKFSRRQAKEAAKLPPPLSDAQEQAIAEESHFQLIKSEYKKFSNSIRKNKQSVRLVGKPWERLERLRLRELASQASEHDAERLNPQHLRDLSDVIELERDKFSWLLENDIELQEGWLEDNAREWAPKKRNESEAIKLLIDRLSAAELSPKDWKFTKIMRFSGLQFTEKQMLRLVEGLGDKGQWRNALSVVEWVYSLKEHSHFKSRFVYTKLLAVLGRCRKPHEALKVFNLMRADAHIYPDMAAYHSLAVTLGQAGSVRELINVINSMKERPKLRNMRHKSWNPELQPDIVVFNAVLNACVPTCQWKGVSWIFQQLRKNGLKPNGASYGLAMEVMLKSGKYDLVHEFFEKMKRSGESLNALTYKVLVRAFWEEGKVNEAVEAVRDMEERGVVGTASVYCELARCLCYHGRWREAILEVNRLEHLRSRKPLAVTLTGMVMSSLDGGHFRDCISLYEYSKIRIPPDVGLINAMLKVYGRNDMFLEARELFEETIRGDASSQSGMADAFTFRSMLEASASALQWEYFEYVYREMTLNGHDISPHKHCNLLVEASSAGKWHLLEHKFEGMLEEGDTPPVQFFTEMACQAIVRGNYGRALDIISTMGYAPFQISFQEWIDFFERNGDRIPGSQLVELKGKLTDHDMVKEATALNFCRALDFTLESCEDDSSSAPNSEDSIAYKNFSRSEGKISLSTGDLHEDSDESGALSAYEILEIWNKL